MKKCIGYFSALLFSTLFFAGCISTKAPTYEVTPNPLETKGGKINVSIKGKFAEKSFNKKGALYVQPILKYQGQTKALKPIIFQGEKAVGTGIVINSKTGGSFSYNDVIDYNPQMNVADLIVNPVAFKEKEGINTNMTLAEVKLKKKAIELGEYKLADGVIYTSERIQPDGKTIFAESGYEKETIISKSATIYFAKDKFDLNFKLELNKQPEAVQKLQELAAQFGLNWKIKNIEINSWASPEGELNRNTKLSDDRAKAGNQYLDDFFKKFFKEMAKTLKVDVKTIQPVVNYYIKSNGEDWDGFLLSVAASAFPDKNSILNVIKSQQDHDKRQQEIRNMCLIYKEVEDKILPPLRRAEIKAYFYMPKKTDAQMAALSTTYPDSLDNKEILHAATLTEDLNTKLAIYKSAVKLYPNDWKCYNNAAVVSVALGYVTEAEDLIQKANSLSPNNSMIINNMGVIALKKNDFVTSKSYFETARSMSVDEGYNLGVIMIKEGKYSEALNSFGNVKCDYNAALAQLMTGNNAEATTLLNCAPKTAAGYYLLAVIGARTNSVNMITENLKKAINLDPSYKTQAAEDREFIKFFNSTEFINSIK